ncbi:hypothetical protein Tco_0301976, partial [Tanacetum coccineum]
CDPLALVDCFTPVEDNIGLLEARFKVWAVFVFLENVTGSVSLLTFFIGVVTPPKLGRNGMYFQERYFMIPLHKSGENDL